MFRTIISRPRAQALPGHALPCRLCLPSPEPVDRTFSEAEPRGQRVPRRSLGTRNTSKHEGRNKKKARFSSFTRPARKPIAGYSARFWVAIAYNHKDGERPYGGEYKMRESAMMKGIFLTATVVLALSLTSADAAAQAKPVQIGIATTFLNGRSKSVVEIAADDFKGVLKKIADLDGELLSHYDATEIALKLKNKQLDLGIFHGHEFA